MVSSPLWRLLYCLLLLFVVTAASTRTRSV